MQRQLSSSSSGLKSQQIHQQRGNTENNSSVNSPFKFFGLFCLVRGIFSALSSQVHLGESGFYRWTLRRVHSWATVWVHLQKTHIYRVRFSSKHELAQINKALCRPCSVWTPLLSLGSCLGVQDRVADWVYSSNRCPEQGWTFHLQGLSSPSCLLLCNNVQCSAARAAVSERRCESVPPHINITSAAAAICHSELRQKTERWRLGCCLWRGSVRLTCQRLIQGARSSLWRMSVQMTNDANNKVLCVPVMSARGSWAATQRLLCEKSPCWSSAESHIITTLSPPLTGELFPRRCPFAKWKITSFI